MSPSSRNPRSRQESQSKKTPASKGREKTARKTSTEKKKASSQPTTSKTAPSNSSGRSSQAKATARERRESNERTGLSAGMIKKSFREHLKFSLAKDQYNWTLHDCYEGLALAVRDRLVDRWIASQETHHRERVKRVYYLSLEYLMGRSMANNLINLGIYEETLAAVQELKEELSRTPEGVPAITLADVLEVEPDAGLGNGGLGRLAACFLDSMATLDLPAVGYGIRYEFGIFQQEIRDGFQVEKPEEWLRYGNPWEIERADLTRTVRFGGRTQQRTVKGKHLVDWLDTETVLGVPYDTPIAGYGTNTVNTLRLWRARAGEEFNLDLFNYGDYIAAVEEKTLSESISKVLYPNDQIAVGKELRFKQQYFFVSCSLQDIVRRFKLHNDDFSQFPDEAAIQLNDTHPSLAIPELMRILLDEERLDWDSAWDICTRTFGYTNHTLLPEALEKWPVSMFERLLPRHLELIYEINSRFLRQVMNKFPLDEQRIVDMSLIEEKPERQVRMAYLAMAGAHSVNGVAALHTQLLQEGLMRNFYELWPEKFNNKTNGVTQRRFLLQSNPELAQLLNEHIGDAWIKDLKQLEKLVPFAEDSEFRRKFREVKASNKRRLMDYISNRLEIQVELDPESIFDIQIKRLHEYKRQLLNVFHIITLYLRLKQDPDSPIVPRTFLFGAKAAPGYKTAKLIIKLINSVADVVNQDPDIKGRLRVLFLPNYNVSMAERLFPAADLSEQISTAGKEASGTGNMKFALNGALTIGTLDGANIEIQEEVGEDNIFIFGLKAHEVQELKASGYRPQDYLKGDPELQEVLNLIQSGFFSQEKPRLFQPLLHSLLQGGDPFMLLADYRAYVDCQEEVSRAFLDPEEWTRKAILNVARIGKFSSDRTIQEYAEDIWNVPPVPVPMDS